MLYLNISSLGRGQICKVGEIILSIMYHWVGLLDHIRNVKKVICLCHYWLVVCYISGLVPISDLLKVGGGWSYSEHERLAHLCVMTVLFPCS